MYSIYKIVTAVKEQNKLHIQFYIKNRIFVIILNA